MSSALQVSYYTQPYALWQSRLTPVKPYTLSYLVPFGTYRLVIVVSAANAKPVTKTLEITVQGDWYDDEGQMLKEGLAVQVL